MARLAISKDYFPAYAALPRKAQRKADEFLRKFEQDSTAAALHLEPIKRTVDRQLRSARIGDDYRVILRAPEDGDVYLVLWADQHDAAYRWAETKQTAVHPATGSLQIFDVSAATEALTTFVEPAIVDALALEEPPELFAAHSDDQLFVAGVPRPLLPSVRALVTDADLDRLLPHLPPETGELLTALAAGIPLDEAIEEILGRSAAPAAAPAPPPIDIADVPAALARDTTQRQFRLVDDSLDLDAALKHPLDIWRVFLHPRQKRIAHARTKGPTRVLGGAGTGKTVVALHRAAFLVHEVFTKPDDRVLFMTFSVNLAHDLRAQLAKILEPDDLARVEVVNLDSWASRYLRSRGVSVRPAFEKEQSEHFAAAYEVYGKDDVKLDFYRMEWREVIQEQGLQAEDDYVRAVRKSRGVPLGRAERRRLWPVFAAYRDNLEHAGMLEPVDILRRARAEIERANEPPRYRAVVVDETQDFSADALRLLRAIAGPERADDLFLVGDAHQRIYGRPVALSQCGIQVRGRRSQTLRLNYRTTGAICRWSLAVLENVSVDDLDDGVADRRGYVSVREGPVPQVHPTTSSLEEERAVVSVVKSYVDAGALPETICVVARTMAPLRDRFAPALQRVGVNTVLLEQEEPRQAGVRLATMHRVKGLEYPIVLLVNVSKHDVPFPTPELRSDDPVMHAHALLRERSLLYVAASRARDALHIFYHGSPSSFLAVAPTQPAKKPEPPARPIAAREDQRPPVSAAAEDAKPTNGLAALLATPLSAVPLPTRMANWIARAGLQTLGELVRYSPSALMSERNLGRGTIRETRSLIESATGRRWEELSGSITDLALGPDADGLAPPSADNAWDVFRASLEPGAREIALSSMFLPVRLRTFVERENLKTLGDLAGVSRAALLAAPNLGRGTITDLPGLIAAHLESLAAAPALSGVGLLDCVKTVIEPLEPALRMIVTRRSGLVGDPLSLKEIGEMLGVSRERVRQLETKACEKLARQGWVADARARVEKLLVDGAVPLHELASDPWWAAATEKPTVVDFVLDHVLGLDARVIELDEEDWVSPISAESIASVFSTLLTEARAVALPSSVSVFKELAAKHAGGLGQHIATHFQDELRLRLQIDPAGPEGSARVLAFGDTRRSELIAILRAASEPMHVDELARRIGRRFSSLPDEVIHFRRGYVGLRAHFADFDGWQARLVPAALRLMQELGPQRQWYTGELLDELREEFDIPDWINAFGLAALMKASGTVRYLGRQRVVLPESQADDTRVYMHDELERLLQQAGEPVLRNELLEKLSQRLGITEIGIATAFNRPQFVRVDADRIGLLARDVPGGTAAITEAGDHVEALLARRGRGLADVHVHAEIVGLSNDHEKWTVPLTMSVLRSDGRFRSNKSGAVGLMEWEGIRMPTRLELIRGALDDAGGRVSIEAALARLEAHYGELPTRTSLIWMAHNAGARPDGEWLVRKNDDGDGLP